LSTEINVKAAVRAVIITWQRLCWSVISGLFLFCALC